MRVLHKPRAMSLTPCFLRISYLGIGLRMWVRRSGSCLKWAAGEPDKILSVCIRPIFCACSLRHLNPPLQGAENAPSAFLFDAPEIHQIAKAWRAMAKTTVAAENTGRACALSVRQIDTVGSQSSMVADRFRKTRERLHGPPQSTRRILLFQESDGSSTRWVRRKTSISGAL